MNSLVLILATNFFISLGALAGIFTLVLKKDFLNKILLFLVSLSAGALMGGAFFHLLPEAAEATKPEKMFFIVLLAFITFFLIEKLLHWRHCHKNRCQAHTFGSMNLIGDSIHNFIDGLIISSAFLTSTNIGMATALAVALHEIPQEIGDFGVLLYSGWSRKKALAANFLVALFSILGGVIGYFLSLKIESFVSLLIPFAAGGFLYISASDLLPEIRQETNLKKSLASFMTFLLGILLMYLFKFFDKI